MNENPQKIVITTRKHWRNWIYKFLAGLNVEFDEVRDRIIGKSPLPSINEAFFEVWREESYRLVMLGKKTVDEPFENSVLTTIDATSNKASNYQCRMDETPWVWCDHCNRPCHTRETCWKIHGKLANWKNNKLEERTSCVTPSANEADS